MSAIELSAAEARQVALSSLGFGTRAPAKAGITHLRAMASRLSAIQIDSVNVLVRAHYMPAFSRLGAYPTRTLDDLVHGRRELFEYIAHAACFIPIDLFPFLRWRMQLYADGLWSHAPAGDAGRFVRAVLDEVGERGPLAAGELSDGGKSTGSWWGWSNGKQAMESLFRQGQVVVAGRRGFERLYDLPERVIPKDVLAAPAVPAEDAKKHLITLAARARGVGTAKDLAGYFGIDNWWERSTVNGRRVPADTARLVRELVEEGRLVPATVEGWKQPAYVVPDITPRTVSAKAVVSPFDPLMSSRKWMTSLFGFDYTIEIYVPEPKRVYGYYVLPFLLGDRFVARVDLKADRKAGTLLVPGAFVEPGEEPKRVAAELAGELRRLADWLALDRVQIGDRGDLVRALRRAVG